MDLSEDFWLGFVGNSSFLTKALQECLPGLSHFTVKSSEEGFSHFDEGQNLKSTHLAVLGLSSLPWGRFSESLHSQEFNIRMSVAKQWNRKTAVLRSGI